MTSLVTPTALAGECAGVSVEARIPPQQTLEGFKRRPSAVLVTTGSAARRGSGEGAGRHVKRVRRPGDDHGAGGVDVCSFEEPGKKYG